MESLVCCGKRPLSRKPVARIKENLKAGTVRHSSTNFFVVWKSSAGFSFREQPFRTRSNDLSSSENITATRKVQRLNGRRSSWCAITEDDLYLSVPSAIAQPSARHSTWCNRVPSFILLVCPLRTLTQ